MNKMKLLPVMAFRGVRQNKLVYRPYLMACFFSVFSYYLFSSLLHNDLMERLPKAAYAWLMLNLGKGLLSIILLLFLIYAGSFLQKRRRKESTSASCFSGKIWDCIWSACGRGSYSVLC